MAIGRHGKRSQGVVLAMRLHPLEFEDLPGWTVDEIVAAWPTYLASCRAILGKLPPLRSGLAPSSDMTEVCSRALGLSGDVALATFFTHNFRPFLVEPETGVLGGFVTGYYEPELEGSTVRTPEFSAPVLARPGDLLDVRGKAIEGWDPVFEGARTTKSGDLEPYPARVEIEAGGVDNVTAPILWLRDHVEVFFAQVQGSARIRLQDGTRRRLVYAGRNGRPYTSIGKILIGRGEIPAEEMSLARCKDWLRASGLALGQRGRDVLQANESYVFFRLENDSEAAVGPTGAQGIALTPLRSVAVDRTIWPYGTPVWIEADLSSAGLGDGASGRLMIAQDTGSAIIGPARGDLFIGSGDRAGDIAGLIRHAARFVVFAPAGMADHGAA